MCLVIHFYQHLHFHLTSRCISFSQMDWKRHDPNNVPPSTASDSPGLFSLIQINWMLPRSNLQRQRCVIPAKTITQWDVVWGHQTNVNPEEKNFETPRSWHSGVVGPPSRPTCFVEQNLWITMPTVECSCNCGFVWETLFWKLSGQSNAQLTEDCLKKK